MKVDKIHWRYTYLFPICIAAGLTLTATWFSHSYKLIFVANSDKCIPGSIFVVDTTQRNINRGDLVMFKSHKTDILPANINIIKIVAGVAGDSVDVGVYSVKNSSKKYPAPIESAALALDIDVKNLIGIHKVASDSLFVLGTESGSYDSRFFGAINNSQVIGRAYLII
ncbi:S26 family signal peptidase [Shewanella sp. SM101]|jgi:conjugal transfer pilin signal peptidase TrbI|uniref:S26 family signal peptidase n=1 Tax=Shewanella TaxID=22 RepID=UPI0021DAE1EE|nr:MULTISPECIES: S26 family signal peptidase [unclassified Shewanella]MCU8009947.1 S26 family signal peptidase [Shewanella sp. SM87]MCU8107103.1 S26 family signal peptidase [Shewanella sp. SM101]